MSQQPRWQAELILDVGDPESVARLAYEVQAPSAVVAADVAVATLVGPGDGFTADDVIRITITRAAPGVAANLLNRCNHTTREVIPERLTAQIPDLYAKGASMREISEKLGISYSTVNKYLTDRRIPKRSVGGAAHGPNRYDPFTSPEAQLILRYLRTHTTPRTQREIADDLRLATTTVSEAIRRAGGRRLVEKQRIPPARRRRGTTRYEWTLTGEGADFLNSLSTREGQ